MKKFICVLLACLLGGLSTFSIAACTHNEILPIEFDDDGEPYTIKYYMPVGDINGVDDIDRIVEAVNEELVTKLPNTTLDIIPFGMQEYSSRMAPIIGTYQPFDICFTSPSFNNYLTNVQQESFFPLDYVLPKYAPKTYAKFDQRLWNQTKVHGHIYGVINNQILPRTASFHVGNIDYFNEYMEETYPDQNANVDTAYLFVENDIINQDNPYTGFDLVEDYMNWLTEKNIGSGVGGEGITGFIGFSRQMQTFFMMDDLGTGMQVPGVVRLNGNTAEVVNQFETEEFDYLIDRAISWRTSGIIPADSSNRGNQDDKLDISVTATWKPGDVRNSARGEGIRSAPIRLGNPYYYTSYVLGTMNAISATSENPARAMKFLELLGNDPVIHNLLQFGEEEVDYYIPDPEKPEQIELITGSGYTNSSFGWGLGDEFLSFRTTNQDYDLWEQVALINNTAEISPVIGFMFDSTPVATELLQCMGIYNRYFNESAGTGFPGATYADTKAEVEKFRSEMKAAGGDKIVAEKQRQLNEWLAAQNTQEG